jgi:ABC-type transport system involved in cytochrome c biogenesis permease subunit
VREAPPEVAAWGASAERPPYERVARQPGNPLATSSLVLSILGLVILLPTFGLGAPLAMPFSIAGWVTGVIGRRQVAEGNTAAGDGIAHAGAVLGIAGVVLGVIAVVVWGILIASGLDLEEFRRDLESNSS